MAQAAEETEKNIVPFTDALNKFSITEDIILDLEKATKLEITDGASEKVVRKHRQNAKSLEVKINKKRLELNRKYKEKTDQAAGLIAPRITAVYQTLNGKITAVETARETAKTEKDKAEKERIAAIQARLDILTHIASKPLEYNRPAADIEVDISNLENFEINGTDFQERTHEAERKLEGGIKAAKTALENRKKFEADQAEVELVKKQQAAEAKRLEAEREEQEKIRKDNEAKATAEAERQRVEREKIKAEVEKLDADKAAAEKLIIVSTREALWAPAHQDNIEFDHAAAIIDHEEYLAMAQANIGQAKSAAMEDLKLSEKYKADAEARAMIVVPDRLMLKTIANDLDNMISEYCIPKLGTDEAAKLVVDLISGLKTSIHDFDNLGEELK